MTPSTTRRNTLKTAEPKHQHLSSCTGKGCVRGGYCGRVTRKGNATYSGPLLHMYGSECVRFGKFRQLENGKTS